MINNFRRLRCCVAACHLDTAASSTVASLSLLSLSPSKPEDDAPALLLLSAKLLLHRRCFPATLSCVPPPLTSRCGSLVLDLCPRSLPAIFCFFRSGLGVSLIFITQCACTHTALSVTSTFGNSPNIQSWFTPRLETFVILTTDGPLCLLSPLSRWTPPHLIHVASHANAPFQRSMLSLDG